MTKDTIALYLRCAFRNRALLAGWSTLASGLVILTWQLTTGKNELCIWVGSCLALLSLGFLFGIRFGHGTIVAYRRTTRELSKGRSEDDLNYRRSRAYCHKVGVNMAMADFNKANGAQ